jgi:anti-sigma factor RsiW
MRDEHLHVTDERLLLHASGESPSADGEVRAHLEGCFRCRARLKELESTLAEFGEAHRKAYEPELPPGDGPRALLKARMTELAARERGSGRPGSAWLAVIRHRQAAVFASVAIMALLLLAIRLHRPLDRSQPMSASLGHWDEPDLRLTPGATVPVTENELCSAAAATTAPAVPVSLKRKVFELYGVTPPQPDAYEVDYLITPELGGATDIRNLWPEPYQDTVWNAHIKDQLEDRLHQMVCRGDVDLATAQHDISTDWIAAYRKYFHVDRPVTDGSSSDSSNFGRSLPRT